jgi:hypothetical protein
MKKQVLLAAVLVLSVSGIAQEKFTGEIRWGTPFELKKKETVPDPIGVSDGSMYALKGKSVYSKKAQYTLQEYDLGTLSLSNETLLNLVYEDNKLHIVNKFLFSGKLLFISYYADEANDKKVYILHEMDGGEVAHVRKIAEVSDSRAGKRMMTASQYLRSSSFSSMISADKESLMILYSNEVADKDDKPETQTILYNKNLEEISRGTLDLDDYLVQNMRLLNNGQLLALGFEAVEGETKGLIKRETIERGDCHMLLYDGTSVEKTPIELGTSHKVNSLSSKIMPDNSVVVYGLYSNENVNGVSGAFFVRMNQKLEVLGVSEEEFEQDFVTQYWTQKQKKKSERRQEKGKENAEPSFYSYDIHDLVVKENGDMTLLAEQYYMYITTSTYTSGGRTYTTTTYHYVYNDIIAVNCTKDGDINWKQNMKKRQHTTNDGGYYSSFFTAVQGNDLYLVYNYSEAALDPEEAEAMTVLERKKARKNIVAASYTIGENGDVTNGKLFDFEEEQARRLVPKLCEHMSRNEILLITSSVKNGTKILGWLTL